MMKMMTDQVLTILAMMARYLPTSNLVSKISWPLHKAKPGEYALNASIMQNGLNATT
jgi:hypothetical protein